MYDAKGKDHVSSSHLNRNHVRFHFIGLMISVLCVAGYTPLLMFTVNFDATQCTLTACTRPLFKAQSGLIGDQTSSERSRDAFGDSPSFGHSLGPWVFLAHRQMEVLEGARYSRADAFLSCG